jgi:branched-chain amino acid transport system ATP-binding protein
MLKVENLSAWYGEAQALRDIHLDVQEGQLITLVGRNGAGKTTTLRSIIGLHPHIQGKISLDGTDVTRWSPDRRARAGLGWVQDDRGIYATLSVEENLLLPPKISDKAWSLERVYQMFPVLKDRRRHSGAKLSGGEQQMLAIGRALMGRPKLLLLDEPSMGLAPLMVEKVFEVIRAVAAQGMTVLLVEQNAKLALELCARGYVMESGTITIADTSETLLADPRVRAAYLGE